MTNIKQNYMSIPIPSSFFSHSTDRSPEMTKEDAERLNDKLDRIERKLDLIFGDSVLVKGQWFSLSNIRTKEGT